MGQLLPRLYNFKEVIMKKYKVKAYTVQKFFYQQVVEAENEEQAKDIAEEEADWEDSDDYDVDWQDSAEMEITSVEEE